jgi:predicted nuclease of restriction endonuclease-like (RecB) superfamily
MHIAEGGNMTGNKKSIKANTTNPVEHAGYIDLHGGIIDLLESARRATARTINTIMTATYWEIGRRIVEAQQKGKRRAGYGEQLIARLAADLTERFGRGFGADNLELMRLFYLTYPPEKISESLNRKSMGTDDGEISESLIRKFTLDDLAQAFTLSWTHYIRFIRRCSSDDERRFYEAEALRGGWTIRQLDRQIESQFYQRVALSRNKAAMLSKGETAQPGDTVTPEEAIKDPYILEFLELKDEYSESALEDALIHRLEDFLLELGDDFAFVGRQRRLRIGDEWYRVDLLFFHRCLRCLVIVDLKIGRFTHADAGQMHLYLNYTREHWTREDENPPVGLILCTRKDASVAHYALEGLPNKVLAAEYRTVLPDADQIAAELAKARLALETRRKGERKDQP